jgi:group I intron endonuclease
MIIYSITNNINKKTYVGKTIKSLEKRFASHINTSNSGSQAYLHRAIRKYGKDNFTASIIEDDIQCENILNEKEIYWIEKLSPEYNMTSGGEGSSGRILSEQSRHKMSVKAKQRTRKPHSEETRQKIANALSGVPLSDERKQNISKSKMGNIPWNKGKILK